ncbi:MAG: PDZ domain-containing protein, partial [Elusimicrobiota bacterium]
PEADKGQKEQETAEWLGVKVSGVLDWMLRKYDIPENEGGVVVIDIEASEKGADFGLVLGDLIKEINGGKIRNVDDFKKAIKKVSLKDGVVFDILRAGQPLYISYSSDE